MSQGSAHVMSVVPGCTPSTASVLGTRKLTSTRRCKHHDFDAVPHEEQKSTSESVVTKKRKA
jgi:hypothetical protein